MNETTESRGTLMAHTEGNRLVTRADLALLPAPLAIATATRHKPVPHVELVNSIHSEIERRGLTVRRESYALAKRDAAIFGVIDIGGLDGLDPTGATTTSFGFRSANDLSLAIKAVAGRSVTVCDNLMLSGDMFAMAKLHTSGLDLPKEIRSGFDKFLRHEERLVASIAGLRELGISNEAAKAFIYDVFAAGTLPGSMLPDVHGWYFDTPDVATDCTPRTHWGLHNSFTRAMKKLKPHLLFRRTVALGEHFKIN